MALSLGAFFVHSRGKQAHAEGCYAEGLLELELFSCLGGPVGTERLRALLPSWFKQRAGRRSPGPDGESHQAGLWGSH